MYVFLFKRVYYILHADGMESVQVGSTIEENSSIFSLVRMRYLRSAKACRQ